MDYPGANSPATMQGNLKEVYGKDKKKKSNFEKLKKLLGK